MFAKGLREWLAGEWTIEAEAAGQDVAELILMMRAERKNQK